ncbi:type VI secretion system-associated FHA domain protein TagH [Aliikangiella sp. G2MR2-5]|uniref:type VI secretion system-associated FHA domain protein TagH n=1 Tax=Aliikangiella sp. G2MR2-5 TaxID=2788943 RepID=UPI0018AC0A29|nr:type VI secretion system-associated FHA domain protein TagH [Aliikangiella sp. G2MR2-5]
MPVVVTILEFPDGVELAQSSMVFDEQGGTLGRSPDNTWVLSDPERFLSGCHSQIVSEGSDFYLVDRSTNGTYVNNSGEPLGKGEKIRLTNGDIFEISDYKFQVSIPVESDSSEAFVQNFNAGSSDLDIDDPFASPVPASSSKQEYALPLTQPEISRSSISSGASHFDDGLNTDNLTSVSLPEETDPLAALDNASESFSVGQQPLDKEREQFNLNSYSDNAQATEQAVDWPSTSQNNELIPQDWDDDFLDSTSSKQEETSFGNVKVRPSQDYQSSQVVAVQKTTDAESISLSESEARRRALEKSYKNLKAQNASLKKQLEVAKKRTGSGVDRTLVDCIGFSEHELSDEKVAEINEICGVFIRKVTEGMMQTLASRNNVKNTFRMNMTTIQPKENNPLKFSANVDDALENMFIKEGNSYKKPIETVEESFESIADHQVAILAGVRSAFNGVAERFDPKGLEGIFQKQSKKGLIPRNEKAQYWDSFCQYYQDLFSDLDTSFQTVFGDEFTLAYEAQLQKLALARRNKK